MDLDTEFLWLYIIVSIYYTVGVFIFIIVTCQNIKTRRRYTYLRNAVSINNNTLEENLIDSEL